MSVTPDWTSGLTGEQLQLVAAANSPADAAAGLHNLLVAALYSDPERAGVLLNAGKLLASASADPLALAYATRGDAHLAYVRNHHEEAAALYATAVELFGRQGAGIEVGRTLSSALQTLIYLGRYEEAKDWAKRAEAIFLRHGDALRLARLDSNAGNIDFRLDQPREAIARYERALEGFREFGDAKDVAAALNNLIVSHTSLGQFNAALAYYGQVREHCQVHGLVPLTAQADYNIAYLYMLRGDYARARRLYDTSREHCRAAGDAYHAALCDLDEAEMSLELNLTREGDLLARRAAAGFEQLGMRYEQAKSLVNIAVAASQRGDGPLADSTLKRARSLFVAEGNVVWPAMIDLLRAVLAFHQQRFRTAQRLSTSASDVLATTMIPSRAAHCQIVLARLWLRLGQADRARAIGREAVARLGADSSPSLRFHAGVLEGEINEIQGRWKEAFTSYESARREVEDLRGRLDTEDLRISILKDKLAVYESLVAMCLDSRLGAERDGIARALLMVQQAKSRSLADRLLRSGESCGSQGPEAERIESLRLDLNWHYRQIELAALMNRAGRPGSHADELRERAGILEAEMMELQAKSRP